MYKVYIWGTGKISKKIYNHLEHVTILGFLETSKSKEEFMGHKVYQFNEAIEEYDAVIVANNFSDEIYFLAKENNFCLDRFIFLRICHYSNPRNNLDWKQEVLGTEIFQQYVAEYNLIDQSFYVKDKELYNKLNQRANFAINDLYNMPIIKDKYEDAGTISSYFWQDLWAARLINMYKPKQHYDIGSRLDGFISNVLSFNIPVHMIDIRPFPMEIEGLNTIVGDATTMDCFDDFSIESLSALCSIEHFGLGRYGDPVDPEACFKCFANIPPKLKAGAHLYLSVPIGKERVEFNAHRIFYASTIINCFKNLTLIEYSCATNDCIEKDVDIYKYDNDLSRGGRFGLFHFYKELKSAN